MSAESPSISFVVPAYNEEQRLAEPLRRMGEYLSKLALPCELIVVDDGSSDDTFGLVRRIAPGLGLPVRVIRYERNRGKGYAIKVGVASATGDRIIFSDADLSTPLEETSKLLASLDRGFDIAIGSRKIEGAQIDIHQSWYRERLGKVFTFIVRKLIADVSDVTCGFKAYRGDVARDLFSRVRIEDWSFDAEILLIAVQRGYSLEEIPVRWEDRAGSKVSLLRDIVNSLIGIARIRINAVSGRYEHTLPIDPPSEEWVCDLSAASPSQAGDTVLSGATR